MCLGSVGFSVEAISLESVKFPPANFRLNYLDSLPESQEYFLEQLVQEGTSFDIVGSFTGLLGYITVNSTHIIELYLDSPSQILVEAVFELVSKQLEIHVLYLKSFDPLISYLDSTIVSEAKVDGLLFRRHSHVSLTSSEVSSISLVESSDVADVMAINDDFFQSKTEVNKYVLQDSLFGYRDEAGDLLACGILSQVIENRLFVDVGMLVAPNHRNKHIGTYVVNHLKNLCLNRGDVPIAGCSAENLASRKALEAAGFITEHHLLELTF
jgi:GNAT superfamily N-acetyltransferase